MRAVPPLSTASASKRLPAYDSRDYDKPGSGGNVALALCYPGVSCITVVHKKAKLASDWVFKLCSSLRSYMEVDRILPM